MSPWTTIVPLSNEYYTKQKLSNTVNTERIDQQESIQEAAHLEDLLEIVYQFLKHS